MELPNEGLVSRRGRPAAGQHRSSLSPTRPLRRPPRLPLPSRPRGNFIAIDWRHACQQVIGTNVTKPESVGEINDIVLGRMARLLPSSSAGGPHHRRGREVRVELRQPRSRPKLSRSRDCTPEATVKASAGVTATCRERPRRPSEALSGVTRRRIARNDNSSYRPTAVIHLGIFAELISSCEDPIPFVPAFCRLLQRLCPHCST